LVVLFKRIGMQNMIGYLQLIRLVLWKIATLFCYFILRRVIPAFAISHIRVTCQNGRISDQKGARISLIKTRE